MPFCCARTFLSSCLSDSPTRKYSQKRRADLFPRPLNNRSPFFARIYTYLPAHLVAIVCRRLRSSSCIDRSRLRSFTIRELNWSSVFLPRPTKKSGRRGLLRINLTRPLTIRNFFFFFGNVSTRGQILSRLNGNLSATFCRQWSMCDNATL